MSVPGFNADLSIPLTQKSRGLASWDGRSGGILPAGCCVAHSFGSVDFQAVSGCLHMGTDIFGDIDCVLFGLTHGGSSTLVSQECNEIEGCPPPPPGAVCSNPTWFGGFCQDFSDCNGQNSIGGWYWCGIFSGPHLPPCIPGASWCR
jgi:hypothetical protein